MVTRKFWFWAVVTVCLSCSIHAAMVEWTGGGTPGIWEDADNWDDGVPGADSEVLFDSDRILVNLGGDTEITSLAVGANATGDRWLLLGEHTLTLGSIINNSPETLFDIAVDLTAKAGGLTVSADTAPIILCGAGPDYVETFTLADDMVVEGNHDTYIYGPVTGAGGLVKQGDGTLVIHVVGYINDFSGDMRLEGGLLVLDGYHPNDADPGDETGNALGQGDIYLCNGTLAFAGSLDDMYSMINPVQTITIDGTVTIDAAHSTTVSYGAVEIQQYEVGLADDSERDLWFTNNTEIGNGDGVSHITFGNAADGDNLIIEFELANEEVSDSSTMTLLAAGGDKHNLTVHAEVEIEHKVTGDGGLRMTADSTGFLLMVNPDNDFTGGFEIAGGAVAINEDALGTGTFTVTGGDSVESVKLTGMLQDYGYVDGAWKDEDKNPWDGSVGVADIANNVEMSGKFTAAGLQIVEMDDYFEDDEDVPAVFIGSKLNISGAVTLTGDTEIAVVTESEVEDGVSSTAVNALSGLTGDNYFELGISGDIGQAGGARTLTKSGEGKLILNGTNAFTGGLNVLEGIVELNGGEAVENTVVVTVAQDAEVIFNTDEVIGGLSGAGTVDGSGDTITLGSGTSNFTGTLENQLGITVADGTHTISSVLSMDNLTVDGGVATLSGDNTYDSGIAITAGTLTLTGTTTLGAGAIVNAGTLVGKTTSIGATAVELATGSTLKAATGGLVMADGTVTVDADASFTLNSTDDLLTLINPTFDGDATINQTGGRNASLNNLDNTDDNTLTLASGKLYLIGDEIWAKADGGIGGIVAGAGTTLILDTVIHYDDAITETGGTIVKTTNFYAGDTDAYLDDLDEGGGADQENLNLKADAVLATSQGGELEIDRNVSVGAGNTAKIVGESTVVVNTALNAGNGATLELDEQSTMQVGGALNVNAGETLNVTGGGILAINSSNAALQDTATLAVNEAKLSLGSANATGSAQVALNNATVEAPTTEVAINKAVVGGNVEFSGNKVVVNTLDTSGGASSLKTSAAGVDVAALSGANNVAVAEGKVTLTGDSTGFSGAVGVNEDAELEMGTGSVLGGALNLAGQGTINGTVKGLVEVDNAAALLTGTGDFEGGLSMLQGILEPGQSPGEIEVSGGDFVLGAGATLNIEVDSAGNHDSIHITDDSNANLVTGARIIAVAIGNGKDGSYNIITLDGAGEIQVDGVGQAADADLIAFAHDTEMATISALVVDGTGKIVVMDVDFSASNVELLTGVGNHSVMSLARLLDSETTALTGDLTAIIGQAQAAGNASQVAAAYAQLTNQLQASASAAASSVVSSVNTNLGRRMQGARAAARNGTGPTDGVLVASLTPTAYTPAGNDGWIGFFEGYGSWGDRKNDGGAVGYDYDTYGALLGAEKFVRDDVLIGGSVGYGRTNVDGNDKLSKLDVDSLSLSFYGTWFSDDTYLSMTFGYGYHSYDSVRKIAFAVPPLRAKGDFKAHTFTLAPEIGKLFTCNDMEIEPFAGLSFTHFRQQSYREKGAGAANLDIDSCTDNSIISELGVRFRRTWSLNNGGRLTPQLKLAWRHDFGDEVVSTVRLAGANASFKTTGIDVVSDIFNVGVGVDWQMNKSRTLYTQYDADFGSGFKSHTLQAGIKILF